MSTINNIKDLMDYFGIENSQRCYSLFNKFLYKYTLCGAWVEFCDSTGNWSASPEVDGNTKYIEGIRIGSIVEGSDVNIGPYELMFPFFSDDLEDIISQIEIEAEEEFELANGGGMEDESL